MWWPGTESVSVTHTNSNPDDGSFSQSETRGSNPWGDSQFSIKPLPLKKTARDQAPKNWTIYNVSSSEPDLSPKLTVVR